MIRPPSKAAELRPKGNLSVTINLSPIKRTQNKKMGIAFCAINNVVLRHAVYEASGAFMVARQGRRSNAT